MSSRLLGPWVSCRWCHNGLRRKATDPWFHRFDMKNVWGGYGNTYAENMKEAGLCHPRLTLIGHIRRILGMQMGEES